jgi:hypothetical protein
MLPAFWPLRNRESEIRSAVASSMGSHSRTTEVWVALRQRRIGTVGSLEPNALKIWSWRVEKRVSALDSEAWLRATVMSTMDPEAMFGGRRMEGNSI